MALTIKIASTDEEIEQVFWLRHKVFAVEEGYYPIQSDSRITDRFDFLSTTMLAIAYHDEKPIATVRITQQSKAGLPCEGDFNFQSHLPYYDKRVACGSMLCVRNDYRRFMRVGEKIIFFAFFWCLKHGVNYLIAGSNPEARSFLAKIGFLAIGDVFEGKTNGLPTLPLLIDFSKRSPRFQSFLSLQHTDTVKAFESYCRIFIPRHENIIHDLPLIILNGEIDLIAKNSNLRLRTGDVLPPRKIGRSLAETQLLPVVSTMQVDSPVVSPQPPQATMPVWASKD